AERMSVMDKAQAGAVSGSGGGALDAAVDAFEAAWRSRTLPDIKSSIDKAPQIDRTALLHELVRVDLEYRWKISAGDAINDRPLSCLPYVIEDYAVRHPELGDASKLPLDLIVEEYRVRQRWGDRPDAAEFARRFPDRGRELTAELIEVDRDLQKEVDTPSKTEFDLSPALAGLA